MKKNKLWLPWPVRLKRPFWKLRLWYLRHFGPRSVRVYATLSSAPCRVNDDAIVQVAIED